MNEMKQTEVEKVEETLPPQKPVRPLKSGQSIVPSETIASTALIFVISIMAFLACLTLGAVSMINSSADKWQSDISREVTIQVKPADGREMDKAIRAASRIALSFDGITKVTALNDAATARLLEPWLGSGLELSELPVPRLLTVSVAEGAKPDFEGIRARLEAEVPGASLDDHRAWVERLTTMAGNDGFDWRVGIRIGHGSYSNYRCFRYSWCDGRKPRCG